MTEHVNPPGPDTPSIGAALRAARKRAGLTGEQLAALAGMSQAKVSRLETGASGAEPADVQRLAEVMGLPSAEAEELTALARQVRNQMRDWGGAPEGLPQRQVEVAALERGTREIRVFNPAIVPGLMQTSSYAQALLLSMSRMNTTAEAAPILPTDVMAAVAQRIERQKVLADRGKSFSFVVTESVLGTGIGSPEDMLGQIKRLRELTRLPNVTFGIIPARAFLPDAPLNMFELLGNRAVVIDLFNTTVTSPGRVVVKLYRDLFRRLEAAAVADVDATLDEYAEHYRRLLGS